MKTIAIIAVGSMLCAVAAPTGVRAGEIRKRERHQERRIEQGERSGSLTPKETRRLENEQENIRDEKARAAADGKITRGERREIRHDQNAAGRDIVRKKHNARHE